MYPAAFYYPQQKVCSFRKWTSSPCPVSLSCEVLGFIISPCAVFFLAKGLASPGKWAEKTPFAYLFVVPCINLFRTVGFICLLFLSRDLKLKLLYPLSKKHWEIHFSVRLRHYPCLWATFNIASLSKGFSFGFCGVFF